MSLLAITTHPIQYYSPIYKSLQEDFDIPTTVIYGSDFSLAGYHDREFGKQFAWDIDLLDGYDSIFLSTVEQDGPTTDRTVKADGIGDYIRQVNPDVILLHGYRLRFDLRAFWIAYRSDIPLIFRAETTDHAVERNRLKTIVRDSFLSWFYKQFEKLLYIGERSKAHYKRFHVDNNQLIFSPYCVNTAPFSLSDKAHKEFRTKTRHTLKISSEQIVLLFSGKIVYRKGADILIDALLNLPAGLRNQITVIFLGDGELRDELQAKAQTNDLDAHFVGFKNQTELSEFYHAADVLVVPSRYGETWGVVVNEALHHGLPCIVSDAVGCAPDLVKSRKTGEIVETNSASALAEGIIEMSHIIRDKDLRGHCIQLVQDYTVMKASEGVAEAYLKTCGSK